jgi:hypothetical protein
MMKKSFILSVIVFIPFILSAQTKSFKDNWYKNWRIGSTGGVSYLVTEVKKDFSKTVMDMNSKANGAFYLHLDKRLKKNIELGIEYEKNYFSGEKRYPGNINWLIYGTRFNTSTTKFIVNPVYYKTNISSWFFNLSYNFKDVYSINRQYFNPFIKIGIGSSSLGVEMGYIDPADYAGTNLSQPLYEKGQGIHGAKDAYITLHMGSGFNYHLSSRFSFNAELMFLFVDCDYLDGIQDYEATKMASGQVVLNRMGAYGIVGELKMGFSYHFNWYKKSYIQMPQ